LGIPALYARIFGYSAEEMIGSSILKLIPEHLHSDEKAIIESIRAGQRVEHFETVRLTKDGRSLDVSVTVSPVKDERGRVIGASKILRDISGRKRIEQSLLQAEKIAATGRMAATIAHEINNPLEAVMNLLYLLRPMITNPDGINYLGSAEDELGRVSHIAKETLGFYLHQIDFFGIVSRRTKARLRLVTSPRLRSWKCTSSRHSMTCSGHWARVFARKMRLVRDARRLLTSCMVAPTSLPAKASW
jgi:PAS domain S-box-containing protein